ncbi:hypothetical protein QVD99_003671 [Batrachochytrium dendrobatidis]|nr:hypothetical protein O5D80_003979 [Batrachochytrium dendrobatidis]KAK5669265.1 hypothetical protein QVD99_003671 [Batrachochytrium dendrobatidis]
MVRLVTACENCVRKKRRCDRLKPSCSACLQARMPCVYMSAPSRKRANSLTAESNHDSDDGAAAPPEADATELAERVQLLESLVQSLEDRLLIPASDHYGSTGRLLDSIPTQEYGPGRNSYADLQSGKLASIGSSSAFRLGHTTLDGASSDPHLPALQSSHSSSVVSLSLAPFTAHASPVIFNHTELDFINRLDLTNRSVKVFGPHMTFINIPFLIRCIHECRFLELSLYSMLLSGPLDMLDFPGRQELAMRCYEAALYELHHASNKESVATVLGLHSMALCSILNRKAIGFHAFIEKAKHIAVTIGLNDETRIKRIPSSMEDHNCCRGVWWGLAQLDWVQSFAWKIMPRIPESLHTVRFPTEEIPTKFGKMVFNPTENTLSDRDIEIEVASNSLAGCFVPCKPGCSVAVSYLTIQRIMSKIGVTVQLFGILQAKSKKALDASQHQQDQRLVLLEASLNGWWYAIPDSVRRFSQHLALYHSSHNNEIPPSSRPSIGINDELDLTIPQTWRPIMILVQAHLGRILIRQERWATAILNNPVTAPTSLAFRESLHAAFEASFILSLVTHHRVFSMISPMFRIQLSDLAVFFMIASKLRLDAQENTRVSEGLVTLANIFSNINCAWTETMTKINALMLDHLSTFDDPVKMMMRLDEIRVAAPPMYMNETQQPEHPFGGNVSARPTMENMNTTIPGGGM